MNPTEIQEENRVLREALRRSTIELEQKNRELDLEEIHTRKMRNPHMIAIFGYVIPGH